MKVQEFRSKVKPYMKLSTNNKDFFIKEVVKFRFDPVRNSPPIGHSGAQAPLEVRNSQNNNEKSKPLTEHSAGEISNGVDDGSFYIKCWLSDDYVFADDLNENVFLLVKEIKTLFVQPFGDELEFDAKKFKYLYNAHAIAEEIQGEEIFKKGDGEKFWDYKSDDNSYLSLGVEDGTGKRTDFYGKIIDDGSVEIYDVKI